MNEDKNAVKVGDWVTLKAPVRVTAVDPSWIHVEWPEGSFRNSLVKTDPPRPAWDCPGTIIEFVKTGRLAKRRTDDADQVGVYAWDCDGDWLLSAHLGEPGRDFIIVRVGADPAVTAEVGER